MRQPLERAVITLGRISGFSGRRHPPQLDERGAKSGRKNPTRPDPTSHATQPTALSATGRMRSAPSSDSSAPFAPRGLVESIALFVFRRSVFDLARRRIALRAIHIRACLI